jgi:hypothetical protein
MILKAGLTKMSPAFLFTKKFLKLSKMVYTKIKIKNGMTKERRGLRHDVVHEVFCFGFMGTALSDDRER